ncbi:hypothetical protein Syun_019512 [Stephania yunnanensis]|uniref:Uncharacterized protein n=1 Tax=Stephania yunnanensis TaxID=152371 RepID=A0AAP0IV00_9MAGN
MEMRQEIYSDSNQLIYIHYLTSPIRIITPFILPISFIMAGRTFCGFIFLLAIVIYKLHRRHLSSDEDIEKFIQDHTKNMPISDRMPNNLLRNMHCAVGRIADRVFQPIKACHRARKAHPDQSTPTCGRPRKSTSDFHQSTAAKSPRQGTATNHDPLCVATSSESHSALFLHVSGSIDRPRDARQHTLPDFHPSRAILSAPASISPTLENSEFMTVGVGSSSSTRPGNE